MVSHPRHEEPESSTLGLGHIVILLLAGVLTSLGERLRSDGFGSEAELVADLVEAIDDYIEVGGMEELDG